jgi:hypothetical protein
MALSIGQLDSITQRYIMPKLFDNIFDSSPLLKKLLGSGQYHSVPGGTYIDIPLAYATTTANGWYQGAESLNTAENDQMTAARYSWCSLYSGITISEEDEMKNGGSAGVLKLLASKAQMSEKTIKDTLGTGLYSDGTNTKSIVGLRDIVAVDQTVGGISQTTSSWWQGQVDSTTTTTTISAVNTQFENASIDNEKPDFLVSTRTILTKYYNLLQPMQRFTDSETAKGGFSNLLFNGAPWVSDSHCPASHLFGLNMKHLWLCYHPERNFVQEPWQKPINQQVKVTRILWMGGFGSSNNRLHFKMSGLTA